MKKQIRTNIGMELDNDEIVMKVHEMYWTLVKRGDSYLVYFDFTEHRILCDHIIMIRHNVIIFPPP